MPGCTKAVRLAREAEFARLAAEGGSSTSIAEAVGVDQSVVGRWAGRNGIDLPGSRGQAPRTSRAKAAREAIYTELAAAGNTAREIADEVGIDCSVVREWARKNGVSFAVRVKPEFVGPYDADFARLHAEGKNFVEIAEAAGVLTHRVQRWGKRAGVVLATPTGRASAAPAAVMERRAIFTELAAEGKTSDQIAEIVGVSRATVTDWSVENKVVLANSRGIASNARSAVVAREVEYQRLADEGKSVPEIAGIVGVTEGPVYSWANRVGATPVSSVGVSRSPRAKAIREARFTELAALGWSSQRIADEVGVSKSNVSSWASSNGVRLGRGSAEITLINGRTFQGFEPGLAHQNDNPETPFRDSLAEMLDGLIEPWMPLGQRADVITASAVYEVEPLHSWRTGAHQVLSYAGQTGLPPVLAVVGEIDTVTLARMFVELQAVGIALMVHDGTETGKWEDVAVAPAEGVAA